MVERRKLNRFRVICAVLWTGVIVVGAALGIWLHTIWWYWREPGHGGFDMTIASEFDVRWSRGAIMMGLGAGMIAESWPFGVGTFVVSFFMTMVVKTILIKLRNRFSGHWRSDAVIQPPPAGFTAYLEAEAGNHTGISDSLFDWPSRP